MQPNEIVYQSNNRINDNKSFRGDRVDKKSINYLDLELFVVVHLQYSHSFLFLILSVLIQKTQCDYGEKFFPL